MTNRLRLLAFAAAALVIAAPSSAATIVLNLTANPANTTTNTFTFAGSTFNTANLIFDPFEPFTVQQGDIIQATITFSSGFTVPASGEQLFGVNFIGLDSESPLGYPDQEGPDNEGTLVFDYTVGPTGLPNNTQGGSCSNCLTSIAGQIPGNSFVFDSISLTETVTELNAPFTIGSASFSYQLRDVGAVPEPATWAMMITGFGLVGGAMRRRRTGAAVIA